MAKTLKPTLRERNRYLVFEVVSDRTPGRKDVVDSIWATVLRLYGEVGASRTSMWVMDYDRKKKKGVVKVNHGGVETVRSAIAAADGVGGGKAVFNVLKVAGTLKKARELL